MLRASLALARASAGRFDPKIAARLVRSGQLPAPADSVEPDLDADRKDVQLLPGCRVFFARFVAVVKELKTIDPPYATLT